MTKISIDAFKTIIADKGVKSDIVPNDELKQIEVETELPVILALARIAFVANRFSDFPTQVHLSTARPEKNRYIKTMASLVEGKWRVTFDPKFSLHAVAAARSDIDSRILMAMGVTTSDVTLWELRKVAPPTDLLSELREIAHLLPTHTVAAIPSHGGNLARALNVTGMDALAMAIIEIIGMSTQPFTGSPTGRSDYWGTGFQSPFLSLLECRAYSLVRALVNNGLVIPKEAIEDGMVTALRKGVPEIFDLMVELGAETEDFPACGGGTLLHRWASNAYEAGYKQHFDGPIQVLDAILARGVDIAAVDDRGRTALDLYVELAKSVPFADAITQYPGYHRIFTKLCADPARIEAEFSTAKFPIRHPDDDYLHGLLQHGNEEPAPVKKSMFGRLFRR